MRNVYLRCNNDACFFHINPMMWPEGIPPVQCPICQSQMEILRNSDNGKEIKETVVSTNETQKFLSSDWLSDVAKDERYWFPGVETAYPSVVAYEYRNLRRFCREGMAYAALLSLRDNFEALLKLEVLLAFAWAAQNGDDVFEKQTVSKLMTPNPSLGTWLSLSSIILKDMEKAGMELPASIPLNKIRKYYIRNDIVNWRNEKIGHGAMGLLEDEELRDDIREKVMFLKELFSSADAQFREQVLFLPKKQNTSEEDISEASACDLILNGADMARGLSRSGQVHFRTANNNLSFCVDPFITIQKHEKKGYGIYYFDNQKTRILTYFLSYAEGSRTSENVEYFKRLRKYLESAEVKTESRADDIYLSENEFREMDEQQMSNNFVRPVHLIRWLKKCLETHDRGSFLLQMERGTGKSVFTEKLSSLTERPVRIFDDLDVRTYHFNRTQTAGSGDFRSGIEWLWSKDYEGKTWARAPRISDFERKGRTPEEAFCVFLKEVLIYSRRNRRKKRLLMILDGLDEISDENLWRFIPQEETLENGIYVLLTSRNPETEKLAGDVRAHLKGLNATERLAVGREEGENSTFLKEYIKNTGLRRLTDREQDSLITLSNHRVLYLGLLCRLAENGIGIGELPDSSRVVSVFLDTLEKRYGEKEAVRFRELLVILCTLGKYESLTLRTLGVLTGENGITLNLIGMVRDLSPMLKTERGEEGNLYTIANNSLAEELERQIPETEDIVRWIVNLSMSVMRDGKLNNEEGTEAAAAHVAELAIEKLPEGLEALGSDADWVLKDNVQRAVKTMTYRRSRERVLDYQIQLFMYLKGTKGADHLTTLREQSGMAVAKGNLGRYKEALEIYQTVYERSRKALGPEHPHTVITQSKIAGALRNLGRYEEALTIYQEVYKKEKKIPGPEHPFTLITLSDMATVLRDLDRYEEALAIYRSVYEKEKKVLGAEDLHTLETQSKMAAALGKLGRHEEAIAIYQEVCEKAKRVLGDNNPSTLVIESDMAFVLGKLGRHEEALAIYQEVYGKSKKVHGEEHQTTQVILLGMAWVLENLDRYEEAMAVYRELYLQSKKVFGENHFNTLEALSDLIRTQDKMGQYEEAVRNQQKLINCRIEKLGEADLLTLHSIVRLAVIYIHAGERVKARETAVYARKLMEDNNKENEPLMNTVKRLLRKLSNG